MKKNLLVLMFMSLLVAAHAQTPVAEWRFEKNALDSVGTAHGNIQPDTYTALYDSVDVREGKYSAVFDGNYSYNCLDPASVKNLDAFTIAFWIRLDNSDHAQESVFEKDGKFRVILLNSKLSFIVATENNGWYSVVLDDTTALPKEKWVYATFYYDGSKLGININGGERVVENAAGSITGKVVDDANGLMIGGGAGNLRANMDDIRFYNVALSADSIHKLYDPYGVDNPVDRWRFEKNTLDESGLANGNVQPDGYAIPYDSLSLKEGNYAITFDGNYNLNCLDPASVKNLDDFTISLWIKLDNSDHAQESVFEKDGKFRVILLNSKLSFIVATENNGWYSVTLDDTTALPKEKWVFATFYYNGSQLGLNINGGEHVVENAAGSITGKVVDDANGLMIGGGAGNLRANMDDIRFYDTALSADAIAYLYNLYPKDLEAPTPPSNLVASNITESSVDLAWDPSTDNIGVAAYYVLQNNVLVDTVANDTSVTITGLFPATRYEFAVIAADLSGNLSDTSNVVTVTTGGTADTEAPTTPANLTVAFTTLASAGLMWDASTDNVGVVAYLVYRDGVQVDSVTVGTLTEIYGLLPGTTYNFTVTAIDASGNESDSSNAVSATTQPAQAPVLVAEWPFEGNVDNVVDDSGEFDGTSNETPVYNTDAKQGDKSLSNDGTLTINCGEPTAALSMPSFSISMWLKMSEAPGQADSYFYTLLQEECEYFMFAATYGQDSVVLGFGIATENVPWWSGAGSFLYDTTYMHAGEWYFATWVYNGAKTYIYLNGQLTMENPYPIWGKTVENGNPLVIGGREGMPIFKGLMDDIRFYTGTLSADSIQALYNSYVTGINDMPGSGDNVIVYPNPASSKIFLENVPYKSEIEIYSITGKSIFKTIAKGERLSVDVSSLSNGIYFLSIENNRKRNVRKIVISR